MSVRRTCKYCGQKISIRKMPADHWVSFDYGTDNAHECYTEPKNSGKPKSSKNTNIDIAGTLNTAMINGYDVRIQYYTKYRDTWTNRVVTPKNIYTRNMSLYLEAYCHYRRADRVFKVKNIKAAHIVYKSSDVAATKEIPSYKETAPPSKPVIENNNQYLFWIVVGVIIIYLIFK